MSSFLTRNIKHSTEYNSGGISGISLLDIRDFESYRFRDDKLYTECYVESVNSSDYYINLDIVNESAFSETHSNGIYRQELTTFVRSLQGAKASDLIVAAANKYLVCFRTMQGRAFTFGSDGGATLSFEQKVGSIGEAEGYVIKLSKNSLYPTFEIDDMFDSIKVLGSEYRQEVITENGLNQILI